jgi:hypothetical protein
MKLFTAVKRFIVQATGVDGVLIRQNKLGCLYLRARKVFFPVVMFGSRSPIQVDVPKK